MKKTFIFTGLALLLISGCGSKAAPPESLQGNTAGIIIPTAQYVPSENIIKYKDVTTCEGRSDMPDCYANRAIITSDPTLCQKLEVGLDDLCLQYYYIQKNDAAVCKRLPKAGIKKTCEKYYNELK
jgi:hypothetical protein